MQAIVPFVVFFGLMVLAGCSSSGSNHQQQNGDIEAIFSKSLYDAAVWALPPESAPLPATLVP